MATSSQPATTPASVGSRNYEATFTAIADALLDRAYPAIARSTAGTMVYSLRQHRRARMLRLAAGESA